MEKINISGSVSNVFSICNSAKTNRNANLDLRIVSDVLHRQEK